MDKRFEANVADMESAVRITYSNNTQQVIPRGKWVYVWVKGRESALDGTFKGFQNKMMVLNVMEYGRLMIPFSDITGVHIKE